MKIYTFFVKTESGDEYGPFCFQEDPTSQEVEFFLRKHFPDEFPFSEEKGPGIYGSYIHCVAKYEVSLYKSIKDLKSIYD